MLVGKEETGEEETVHPFSRVTFIRGNCGSYCLGVVESLGSLQHWLDENMSRKEVGLSAGGRIK